MSNENGERWFTRNRGHRFSDLLRESAGEEPLDDQWLEQLSEAERASLSASGDLVTDAAAALERLERCLADVDRAVAKAEAASVESRSLLERLKKEVDKKATSGWVKAKRGTRND